ncbi:MAG: cytochrome c [Planctomycetes bacterium]|nr:cytochrome c [Planctomycetota bacterium]
MSGGNKMLDAVIDIPAKQLDKARDVAIKLHNTFSARTWIGVATLIAALAAGGAAFYLQRDFSKRNVEIVPIPDMSRSGAGESQMAYPELGGEGGPFADARVDREAPVGTFYRGQGARTFPLGTGEAERIKSRSLVNPHGAATGAERDAVVARGKLMYKAVCQGCHGVEGAGEAPVTEYGIGAPGLVTGKAVNLTDGEICHTITHGFNTMAPHAAHLSLDDRWKVVAYLRFLQKGGQ